MAYAFNIHPVSIRKEFHDSMCYTTRQIEDKRILAQVQRVHLSFEDTKVMTIELFASSANTVL